MFAATRPWCCGLLVVALLAPLLTPSATAADPPAIEATHGMVVAAEPLAAEAGLAMLRRGGNAIDAAVATGFALAVTYPVAGNLGGGGFLVARLPGPDAPELIALDFREVAPAGAHREMYTEAAAKNASTLGHLAAGVPGSVAGLLDALERWGRLDRATVLAPAIRLAREGFAVNRRSARFFANERISRDMCRFPETARIFYPGGNALSEGSVLKQPDLATTLEGIAQQGRAGFYQGPVAAAIVAEMERGGGIITAEDLSGYQPVLRKPIVIDFRGQQVVTMPPPSSGGICLQQMLAMLEPLPLEAHGHNSSASLHLLAEVMRRSFADRNRYLGDPDGQTLPLATLLSKERIDSYRGSIRQDQATPSTDILSTNAIPKESDQTTHYSIYDGKGGAVSVTTTLNGAFGCKVVVPGTGFLLNNEMDDFAARPGEPNLYGLVQGEANAVRPGRRPLSSMTPTVVLDEHGHPRQVLGSPGGPTIITNVLQVFLNLVVFGLEPQAAVNAPKIHHQCLPDQLSHEPQLARDVLDALRARGHKLAQRGVIGDFQLIVIEPASGRILGATDPRGGGAVRGY